MFFKARIEASSEANFYVFWFVLISDEIDTSGNEAMEVISFICLSFAGRDCTACSAPVFKAIKAVSISTKFLEGQVVTAFAAAFRC